MIEIICQLVGSEWIRILKSGHRSRVNNNTVIYVRWKQIGKNFQSFLSQNKVSNFLRTKAMKMLVKLRIKQIL